MWLYGHYRKIWITSCKNHFFRSSYTDSDNEKMTRPLILFHGVPCNTLTFPSCTYEIFIFRIARCKVMLTVFGVWIIKSVYFLSLAVA